MNYLFILPEISLWVAVYLEVPLGQGYSLLVFQALWRQNGFEFNNLHEFW